MKNKKSFSDLINIINDLREKCPWDKKQTKDSLRTLTLEECYELSDSILSNDFDSTKKELGDILTHIVFYSKIFSEKNIFSIDDVIHNQCEKLIRRHPFVFANKRPHSIEEQREAYFSIKDLEKAK